MRKTFFGIYAFAVMITACSNDETLDVVAKTPITFGNAFVEKSTRGVTDNTYGGGDDEVNKLKKFNVYGTVTSGSNSVNIYNGDEVTGEIGQDTWNCTTTQYWVTGCDYKFIALVDADVKNDAGGVLNQVTCDKSTGMPTFISYNVASQKDLLLATTEVDKDDETFGEAVTFTFNHLLAKAVFTFTNGFSEDSGVKLTVKDVKITNAPQTGTYAIDANSWTVNEQTDAINFGSSTEIEPGGKTGKSANVSLLLPGKYTFQISFTIAHNKGGTDTPKTMTTGEIEIKAGNSYNFTAELNESNVSGVVPIVININKHTWEDGDNGELGPVYPEE